MVTNVIAVIMLVPLNSVFVLLFQDSRLRWILKAYKLKRRRAGMVSFQLVLWLYSARTKNISLSEEPIKPYSLV